MSGVVIYCAGKRAVAVPVYLAVLSPSGRPRVTEKTPVYHRCSQCGEILPRQFGAAA